MRQAGGSRARDRAAGCRTTQPGVTAGGAADSWRDMGRDALLAGDPAEALWFLRHAVEIDGDDAVCWQLMGRCFEEIGEERRARKCYQIAIRQYRESGDVGDRLEKGPLGLLRRLRQPRDT